MTTPEKLPPMTVGKAATALGVSTTAVYGWMNDGTLVEVPADGVRLVTAVSVHRLRLQREADAIGLRHEDNGYPD